MILNHFVDNYYMVCNMTADISFETPNITFDIIVKVTTVFTILRFTYYITSKIFKGDALNYINADLQSMTIKINDIDNRLSYLESHMTMYNSRKDVDLINDSIDTMFTNLESVKDDTYGRFKHVQRNFELINEHLPNFTTQEFNNFVRETRLDLELIKNAIFIPEESEETVEEWDMEVSSE